MGNTDSRNSIDNSSEFFENANTQNQTGGNDQFNQFDIDLSILESESDFNQDRHGGFNNASDDSIKTEDFINILKSKIDNLSNLFGSNTF